MRQKVAEIYKEELSNQPDIILPKDFPGCENVYHLFMARTESRMEFRGHLTNAGIGTDLMYPELIPETKYFKLQDADIKHFYPNAVVINNTAVALPMFPQLSKKNIEYICDSINNFYSVI